MRRRGGLMQDDDSTRKDTNFSIACGLVRILENDVVIGTGPIAVHHLVLVRLHNVFALLSKDYCTRNAAHPMTPILVATPKQ